MKIKTDEVLLATGILALLLSLGFLACGCCTWQGLADSGLMGAGWKNTEVQR
jgi:hypothetical protein